MSSCSSSSSGVLWEWGSESTPVRWWRQAAWLRSSRRQRERERERPDCNILSVNPSQSPLLPESLSSSVISLCWHLEFQYSERHPSLTSGQDRAELDGRFHNFSLSLCPSGVIWSSRRSSVGNIKIRFTEIRVWKSTTFDKNYTLILTVHFMRRFKIILESNTIIW